MPYGSNEQNPRRHRHNHLSKQNQTDNILKTKSQIGYEEETEENPNSTTLIRNPNPSIGEMSEEGKNRGVASYGGPSEQPSAPPPPPPYYYGTFQGVINSQYPPPPQPVIGFPQPMPPPGVPGNAHYYSHGYQTVPGYAVPHGRPYLEHRLPCCGIGLGWFLFIFGFFFGAIPWYIGAFVLLCVRVDYREKPGLIACTLAAMLAMIAIMLGVTKVTHGW